MKPYISQLIISLLIMTTITVFGAQEKEKPTQVKTPYLTESEITQLVAASRRTELLNEQDLKEKGQRCGKPAFFGRTELVPKTARQTAESNGYHFGEVYRFDRGQLVLIPEDPNKNDTPLINAVYLYKNGPWRYVFQIAPDKTTERTHDLIGVWSSPR
jgi:hypothetical protein